MYVHYVLFIYCIYILGLCNFEVFDVRLCLFIYLIFLLFYFICCTYFCIQQIHVSKVNE